MGVKIRERTKGVWWLFIDHRRTLAAEALQAGRSMPEWVFPSVIVRLPEGAMPEEVKSLDADHIRKVFDSCLKKAGLRKVRFHDLRHSFASWLIGNGESLPYVRDQLGHHSIQITVDTYGHLIPGANRQAVNRLDDAGWEATIRKSATQAQPAPIRAES